MDDAYISAVLDAMGKQGLLTKEEPKPNDIPTFRLMKKATKMSERGYCHNATSLKALRAYMQGYGILLSGGVGVGKTMFFKTVEPDGGIPVLPFNSCVLWRYDELQDWLANFARDDIVVDDIGWDKADGDGLSRNYGQKFDALQIVLDSRSRSANRTHFTTNLDNDGLLKTYDYHLVDRIYGFAKCFRFPEDMMSRRVAKPNQKFIQETTT